LSAQTGTVSFTSPSSVSTRSNTTPAIADLSCNTRDNKVYLHWTMDQNQDKNQFEIERSTDGKKFVLAALLFGTDKEGTEDYKFYEKARSKKTFYRIKIIGKDGSVSYSGIITTKTDPAFI
jgi:hypothetical protein